MEWLPKYLFRAVSCDRKSCTVARFPGLRARGEPHPSEVSAQLPDRPNPKPRAAAQRSLRSKLFGSKPRSSGVFPRESVADVIIAIVKLTIIIITIAIIVAIVIIAIVIIIIIVGSALRGSGLRSLVSSAADICIYLRSVFIISNRKIQIEHLKS